MRESIEQHIARLKDELGAVILAHNYQLDAVQDLADFTGDSLGLSQQAAKVDADVIVFCGVMFMAETAALLNPDKLVLIPDPRAGCPMARMVTPDQLRELKAEHPGAAVVCYVNSTAEIKALSDVCCTSSNAVEVVESIEPGRRIIFVPDRHLGQWVAHQTGRDLVLYKGFCPTHVRILPEHITALKLEHPAAEVMVHPECLDGTVEMADVVTSTGGMLKYARTSAAKTIIIGTETGLLHRLRIENPDKEFIPVTPAAVCPNMKLITPEKVLWSLQEREHEVTVPEDVAGRARAAVERMLALGTGTAAPRGT